MSIFLIDEREKEKKRKNLQRKKMLSADEDRLRLTGSVAAGGGGAPTGARGPTPRHHPGDLHPRCQAVPPDYAAPPRDRGY